MKQLPLILPISDLYRKLFGPNLIDVYVVKDEWIDDHALGEMITLRLKGVHGINEKIKMSTRSNTPTISLGDEWYTVLIFANASCVFDKQPMVWLRRISTGLLGRFPEEIKPKIELFLEDAFHEVRGQKIGEEVGVL